MRTSLDNAKATEGDERMAHLDRLERVLAIYLDVGQRILFPMLRRVASVPGDDAAWTADGRFVIGASKDRTARVWNADGTAEPVVLRGHETWLPSAAFSADGPAGGSGVFVFAPPAAGGIFPPLVHVRSVSPFGVRPAPFGRSPASTARRSSPSTVPSSPSAFAPPPVHQPSASPEPE